jgi:hypothetical protein
MRQLHTASLIFYIMMKLHFLRDETFCANIRYRLIELSQLSKEDLQVLGNLLNNEDVFGIFKSLDLVSVSKVAYKDVALLFFALQNAGELPHFIKNIFDDDINTTIAHLVMDGILLINWNNKFVFGSEAQPALFKEANDYSQNPSSFLSDLSYQAIRYALQLNGLDTRSICTRLYGYNILPVFPQRYSTINTVEEVKFFLKVVPTSPLERLLNKEWSHSKPTEQFNWLSWHRLHKRTEYSQNKINYKIYLSPFFDEMPEVFEKVILILSKTNAFSFKTGASRYGLLRSDKFVIYFHTYSDLEHASILLQQALNGYSAQGVPFTSQLDKNGLLSWGVDPPRENVLINIEGGSWRAQVAEKIAIAISQANVGNISKHASFDFVLNKISLQGIDPLSWTPKENIWN